MVHAELAENWGLKALARHLKAHTITEMRHAERHMERILFLEGFPEVSRIGEIRIGKNVNRPNTNRFGPTNSQPMRELPSTRCPRRNSGSKRLKKSASKRNKTATKKPSEVNRARHLWVWRARRGCSHGQQEVYRRGAVLA